MCHTMGLSIDSRDTGARVSRAGRFGLVSARGRQPEGPSGVETAVGIDHDGGFTGESTQSSGSASAGPLPGGSPPDLEMTGVNKQGEARSTTGKCTGACLAGECGRECGFRRRAFTLIELLVVTTIIAVVIALLLLEVQAAR